MGDLDEPTLSVLLLRHWDVLGVADLDVEPEVEYRHEAAQLLAMLREGADRGELAAWLTDAAESLGASRDLGRDRRAAEATASAYRTQQDDRICRNPCALAAGRSRTGSLREPIRLW